jgi:uncharacterized YigZ family protein
VTVTTPRRYPIPARAHRTEVVVERSRFITTVGPAATVDEARAFVAGVAREFADASHSCWAYVVGPPGDTGRIGMSDAGEPRGTAGRPMLNALLGSGVGDVAAVVTRYFGGVKLGTGGLARAYAACVKDALAGLSVIERVPMIELRFTASYAGARELGRLLDEAGAVVLEKSYGAEVLLRVNVPADREAGLRQVLGGLHGLVRIEPDDPRKSA